MNLRRVVAEERDTNEWLEGNILRATEMLEAAHAQAAPASVNMLTENGQTKEVLLRVRDLAGDAITALEGHVPEDADEYPSYPANAQTDRWDHMGVDTQDADAEEAYHYERLLAAAAVRDVC